jgi:hypothetical protein
VGLLSIERLNSLVELIITLYIKFSKRNCCACPAYRRYGSGWAVQVARGAGENAFKRLKSKESESNWHVPSVEWS